MVNVSIRICFYIKRIKILDREESACAAFRRELENRIGQNGRVVTDQREYMTMVNQHIFGFETTEKYQELMQTLIQLRSPKLSRDFKPSVIYEILNESLPSFSDEDLRPWLKRWKIWKEQSFPSNN